MRRLLLVVAAVGFAIVSVEGAAGAETTIPDAPTDTALDDSSIPADSTVDDATDSADASVDDTTSKDTTSEEVDATTDATADASLPDVPLTDASLPGTPVGETTSCGCRVAGGPRSFVAFPLFAMLFVGAIRRRRR